MKKHSVADILHSAHVLFTILSALFASSAVADGIRTAPDSCAVGVDLSGEWTVTGTNFTGRLRLPGTLADAKLGRPMTAEDWRTTTDRRQKGALMRAYQYTGPATYAREIELSSAEAGRPLEVVLERVMWKSTVRWDGENLGSADSLSTPHVHVIPAARATAGRHRLEIDVDNSRFYDFSGWAHSYGPVMQSVWHGVLGRMEIRPVRPLADARVFPHPADKRRVDVEVPGDFRAELGRTLVLDGLKALSLSEAPSPYCAGRKLVTVTLGETPVEWNEFHPQLYTLVLGEGAARRRLRFGFRQIATRGRELLLNGQPFFMRGNLDCCNFPLSGAPDMSVEGWRRIFERLRGEGINTVRFHSWCPPEAAFVAADELGIYFGVEAAIWVDGWMGTDPVGRGKPIDGFTQRELKSILAAYGDHPSFISLGIGNELSNSEFKNMGGWLNDCRKIDPRHLYFASTARAISPGDDYLVTHAYPGIGGVRCWFHPHNDWDYETAYSKCGIPCVAHEIGQWPVYPDWNELSKYAGTLRPYNLEALRANAVTNGTLRFNREYSRASARLNRLMYRDEVESFFRTRSCSGFQLLGVQDFSGQFEALIGWLDSFYDVKPAVRNLPPFSKVSNALPHLARFAKYVWQEGETFSARLLVRNLTDREIPAGRVFTWSSGPHRGEFRLAAPLPVGDLVEVGTASFPLVAAEGAKRTLRFGENEWTFWMFPKCEAAKVPENVVLTADYETMAEALKLGRRVVYVGDSVGMGSGRFKPVYWSTGFFPGAAAETSTLGAWVDAAHPALAGFPTEDWTDFQWQSLADGARIHRLAGLPSDYRPIVMPVPDLHYSTFLGSVFELSVGEGRLLVCGYAIEDPQGPAAVALRNSLLAYAAGESFKPSAKADFEWLSARFRPVWRDRLAPRPAEFREAPVYIECAVGMPSNGGMRWMRGYDRAELAKGTYRFDGKGTGIWKDGTGTFWYGRRIDFTLKDIPPTAGELRVRFRDPNRNGRTGRGVFEGAAFEIPAHQDNPDGVYWLRLPLLREQALDGRLEFSCEALTGPNLMIDRIVVIPADAASAAASVEPPRLRLPRKAEQELAYLKPACDWNHALPVGNGRLGGMVFGGVGKETVQLNEDTIWTGSPNELTVKGFREALPEARQLLFAGDFAKGQSKLPGYPYTQKYQPFGSLEIARADSAVTDYERTLDLDRAVATVTYVQDGVTFTEEVISSLADGVLVVRHDAYVRRVARDGTQDPLGIFPRRGVRPGMVSRPQGRCGVPSHVARREPEHETPDDLPDDESRERRSRQACRRLRRHGDGRGDRRGHVRDGDRLGEGPEDGCGVCGRTRGAPAAA